MVANNVFPQKSGSNPNPVIHTYSNIGGTYLAIFVIYLFVSVNLKVANIRVCIRINHKNIDIAKVKGRK